MKQTCLRQNSLLIAASELVELTCYEHVFFVFLGERVWGSSWENLSPFKVFLGSNQNIALVE